MYQSIGGIDMLEPGYKKSKIAPKLSEFLSYTEASLETMYGKIAVRWKVVDEKINLKVEIPHNTSSVITLPNVKDLEKLKKDIAETYNEKKVQVNLAANGMSETYTDIDFGFSLSSEGSLSFEVGSGVYTFIYDYNFIV